MALKEQNRKLTPVVIKVVLRVGRKAFKLGSLHFDQLQTYHILAPGMEQCSFRMFRNGQLFDGGSIEEFGTHAALHMFRGLTLALPGVSRVGMTGSVFGHWMVAEWFKEGDELHFISNRHLLRERILRNWHEQLTSTKFKKSFEQAAARRQQLTEQAIKRVGGWEKARALKDGRFALQVLRNSRRIAFKVLDRRLRSQPLPSIIHCTK